MILKTIKNLNSLKNRFKVEAKLEFNETSEDLLNEIKDKVKDKDFELSQKLCLKSEYRENNKIVAIFEPKQSVKLSKVGLKLVSKTNNIFRDTITDNMWKEIIDDNGNKKLIRIYDENLTNLIKNNAQLKMAAFVISTKSLTPGDLITYVVPKGNIEVGLVISEDFVYNLIQNKVQKMSSISSDDITSYKSNSDSCDDELNNLQEEYRKNEDINYIRQTEDYQKNLQNGLSQIRSNISELNSINNDKTLDLLTRKEKSNALKKQLKSSIASVINNKICKNRYNNVLKYIKNY